MRRVGTTLALAVAALSGGCAYDPYTHAYEPCCYYGGPYGAYQYPPPAYAPYGGQPAPYGGPSGGPPPGSDESMQGPPPGQWQSPGPPDVASRPPHPGALAQRFAAANITHDGRLTREQAWSGMPVVARDFDAIDIQHKGYVTLPEIRAYLAQRRPQGAPAG